MNLIESYEKIKTSIVAFAPLFQPISNPEEPPAEFPPIFGTGFIIGEGIVVTNDHVAKVIPKLPKPKDCPPEIWPVNCLLWHFIPGKGMATIRLDVLGVMGISHMEPGEIYYGPPKPDIAFVHVKMKGLPKANVKYNLREIKEGRDIATAGFPMGTDTLTAPGYLHQLTPTLQKGIISAILPFPCDHPHALMINVMVQGGASGSPVFLPETGEIVGILYAGLEDNKQTKSGLPRKIKKEIEQYEPSFHSHFISLPTNISYVVPAHYIEKMLDMVKDDPNLKLPEDTLDMDEYISKATLVGLKRGETPPVKIWTSKETLRRKLTKL